MSETKAGKRSPRELGMRYGIFLIGLFINSLGVSLITKANLGTSPISSIPYVLSLEFPWSMGVFTILFNVLLVILQLILLQKKFKPEYWLQIPVAVLFGWFIDLTMMLLGWMNPQGYLLEVVSLLIGCAEEDIAYNERDIGVPPTIRQLKAKGVPHETYFTTGSHDWFCWPQMFAYFAENTLWK